MKNSGNSLALIVVAGALFFLFGRPLLAEINSLGQDKQEYQTSIFNAQNLENKKNELLSKMNAIPEAEKQKIGAFLPDSPNIVGLVSDVDKVATRYGISITNIFVGAPNNFASAVSEEVAAPKDYKSATLGFEFDSTYDNMKRFIVDLESSLRLLEVRSIDFNEGKGSLFTYKVTAEIYWLAEKSADPVLPQ